MRKFFLYTLYCNILYCAVMTKIFCISSILYDSYLLDLVKKYFLEDNSICGLQMDGKNMK